MFNISDFLRYIDMNILNANSSAQQNLHVTPRNYAIDSVKIIKENGGTLVFSPIVTIVANWVILTDVFDLPKGVHEIICYNGVDEVYKGLLNALDGNEILKSEIIFV